MTHKARGGQSAANRSGLHRLLPIAGISVAVGVVLAHLAGGAALLHLGPGAALANLGGGALAVAIVAVIAVKLLVVFAAQRWLRHR